MPFTKLSLATRLPRGPNIFNPFAGCCIDPKFSENQFAIMCEAGKERLQWQDGVGNIQVRNILAKKILRVGKYSVGQPLS